VAPHLVGSSATWQSRFPLVTAVDARLLPARTRLAPDEEAAFRADFFSNSLLIVRVALGLAVVLYALFGVLDLWIVPSAVRVTWTIRFAIECPLFLATLALTYHRVFERLMQPMLGVVALCAGLGIIAMIAVAGEHEGSSYYAGLVLVIVWAYTLLRLRFALATAVGWALVASYEVVTVSLRPVALPVLLNNSFFFVSANVVGMLGCFYMERYLRLDFSQRRQIEVERAKAERLLLNILPESIAERLKRDEGVIADGYEEVTVLFADIVDFTPLSAGMSPLELVHLLNRIFSKLDELVETHGLEKIKTIGDAYMVVGGLPRQRDDHAEAVADLALDIREAVAHFHRPDGTPIVMRIGIHSGPVVAGVIGTKKFIYDLWGDAVNTASRMESHGVAGAIQVTESTWALLRHSFRFKERGPLDVKGKGPMRVWLLEGRRLTDSDLD
jgi:class 3 adenylate cyclase